MQPPTSRRPTAAAIEHDVCIKNTSVCQLDARDADGTRVRRGEAQPGDTRRARQLDARLGLSGSTQRQFEPRPAASETDEAFVAGFPELGGRHQLEGVSRPDAVSLEALEHLRDVGVEQVA